MMMMVMMMTMHCDAPLPSLSPLSLIHPLTPPPSALLCGSRFISTLFLQKDFDRFPCFPHSSSFRLLDIHLLRSLLLRPLPRSGLYQKGISFTGSSFS